MPEPPEPEHINLASLPTVPQPIYTPAEPPHVDDFVNFVFESDFGADSTGKAVFRNSVDHSACESGL